jgi:hypothetical protein
MIRNLTVQSDPRGADEQEVFGVLGVSGSPGFRIATHSSLSQEERPCAQGNRVYGREVKTITKK